VDVAGVHMKIEIPAGTQITLDLAMDRYVNEPSYHNSPF
jgi:hypothetical protein